MKSKQVFDSTFMIGRSQVRVSTIKIIYDDGEYLYETVSFHSTGSTYHGNWDTYANAETKHLEVIHAYHMGKWS